MKLRIYKWQ